MSFLLSRLLAAARPALLQQQLPRLAAAQQQPAAALHRLEVAGQGHPYRTQLVRKRQLRDPNEPGSLDSGYIESLKWANWRMLKDVKARRHVCLNYATRISLLTLFRSPHVPQVLRDQARHDLMHSLPSKSVWGRLTNRCTITSRQRGKVRPYRVSRFIFRQMADYNHLAGVIKSKWGP